MGSIMPASMQTATLGVDRAVRRRRLGDGQHQPAGRRLDRHGAAQHARRDRGDRATSPSHLPATAGGRGRGRGAQLRRRRTGGAPGSSPSARSSRRCCSGVASTRRCRRTTRRGDGCGAGARALEPSPLGARAGRKSAPRMRPCRRGAFGGRAARASARLRRAGVGQASSSRERHEQPVDLVLGRVRREADAQPAGVAEAQESAGLERVEVAGRRQDAALVQRADRGRMPLARRSGRPL